MQESHPSEPIDSSLDDISRHNESMDLDGASNDAQTLILGDVAGPLELGGQGVQVVSAASTPAVGHKFPLPTLPLPSKMHVKHRYDPLLVQLTRLLMKDGKLSKAQRVQFLTHFQLPDTVMANILGAGYGHDSELPAHRTATQDQSRSSPPSGITAFNTPPSRPDPLPSTSNRLRRPTCEDPVHVGNSRRRNHARHTGTAD
jgi:hypothetical protein